MSICNLQWKQCTDLDIKIRSRSNEKKNQNTKNSLRWYGIKFTFIKIMTYKIVNDVRNLFNVIIIKWIHVKFSIDLVNTDVYVHT